MKQSKHTISVVSVHKKSVQWSSNDDQMKILGFSWICPFFILLFYTLKKNKHKGNAMDLAGRSSDLAYSPSSATSRGAPTACAPDVVCYISHWMSITHVSGVYTDGLLSGAATENREI